MTDFEKKKAIEYAEKNLVGISVYCKAIGHNVYFTKQGCKHAISANITPSKVKLIFHAKELVKSGVLYSREADKKGRKEIKAIFKLINNVVIDKERYKVLITLRQMENNHIYYDHSAIEVRKV